ncbi:uncharacterized protein T551_03727 [Pneumocystis jirovecii RU7]|uniref:Uncharacterized protein n=1 Tax=Pneumocystis jirovecii (strain RU7) TaxID=1408657 RepID=A0A0W4ZAU6_PNEJ7|nr:uncharacterized protein T551_03727 [Pneumocystis jirovecii RU7]KTW25490.1 hypothetical protein T551_03727 [Pneumocystis jirovecii RU7]
MIMTFKIYLYLYFFNFFFMILFYKSKVYNNILFIIVWGKPGVNIDNAKTNKKYNIKIRKWLNEKYKLII